MANYVNHHQQAGEVLASEEYKRQTSAPKTPLDQRLALADTRTKIGREFTLLIKNNLVHQEWVHFQQALTSEVNEQKRAKEKNLDEIKCVMEEEHAREQLKSRANSQKNNTPTEEVPELTKGLIHEILEALLAASKLPLVLPGIAKKLEEWNELNQVKAKNIINAILNKGNEKILGEELVALVKAKQEKLTQTLMPAPIQNIFKMNPHLAEKIRTLDLDSLSFLNSLDFISELNFNANLVNGTEPLMGASLLQAIQERQKKFKQAGISFQCIHGFFAPKPKLGQKRTRDDLEQDVDSRFNKSLCIK